MQENTINEIKKLWNEGNSVPDIAIKLYLYEADVEEVIKKI